MIFVRFVITYHLLEKNCKKIFVVSRYAALQLMRPQVKFFTNRGSFTGWIVILRRSIATGFLDQMFFHFYLSHRQRRHGGVVEQR